MSIRPGQSFPPAKSAEAADANVRASRTDARPDSGLAQAVSQPVSASLPKPKTSGAPRVPITNELPQGVVEVHHDPKVKDQIIIQYLDQSKNLIQQVSSDEELSVERGIATDSEAGAKLHSSQSVTAPTSEGEKTHGH